MTGSATSRTGRKTSSPPTQTLSGHDRPTLEAGLRAEQTRVSYTIPQNSVYYANSDAYDYFDFFPNVKATYALGGDYRLPQLTNVYEVGLARPWDGGSVTSSGYHRDISDAFQRILAIDSSNPSYDIVNRLYENVGHSTPNRRPCAP